MTSILKKRRQFLLSKHSQPKIFKHHLQNCVPQLIAIIPIFLLFSQDYFITIHEEKNCIAIILLE